MFLTHTVLPFVPSVALIFRRGSPFFHKHALISNLDHQKILQRKSIYMVSAVVKYTQSHPCVVPNSLAVIHEDGVCNEAEGMMIGYCQCLVINKYF